MDSSSFRRLLAKEVESRNAVDNVRNLSECSETEDLQNPTWRKLVVQWCYAIVESIGADREIVYLTFDILDRFLAQKFSDKQKLKDKKYYEAAVMSSLLMAARLLSNDSRLCMNSLVDQSAISTSINDIRNTCKDIYQSLNWEISSPTALQFARSLVNFLPMTIKDSSRAELLRNTIRQIESVVEDECCMRLPSSLIAWMSLENALCHGQFPADDKCAFRSVVTEISGHSYSMQLRYRLNSKVNLSRKRKVIEKNQEDESKRSKLRRTKRVKYLHNLLFERLN